MSQNIERDLNWQVVNLKVSGDDLRDAPIVYIAGSDALRMPEPAVEHLREYIEAGGIILGNADCGKKEFADSFVKLGQQMFPGYAFRALEADHPILTREQFPASEWKPRPTVLGLSNGVRELMLIAPDLDLGRAWQMRAAKEHAVEYQLGADIFVYAIDKRALRYKGESPVIRPNPRIVASRTLKVARIEVGDNWNPEPGGWRRMAALLHNDFQLNLDVQPVKLEPGSLAGFHVAHLTGTTRFLLSDVQRKALADFVTTGGGTLIIDAAGGSQPFADSAEAELRAMLPADAPKGLATPLAPIAPLYALPSAPIHEFTYRSFARESLGPDVKSPRLDAIDHDGRPVVYFSREDLTEGLVGQAVDGIRGYSPDTATAIMRNILLTSAETGK
jgi:hypothetical protein